MRLSTFSITTGEASNYDSAYLASTTLSQTEATSVNTRDPGAGFAALRDNAERVAGSITLSNPTSHGNYNVYTQSSVTSDGAGSIKFDGIISAKPEPNNLSTENYVYADIIMFVVEDF
jgi:hypothetical protein